jgi:cell division septation protein DedD
MEAPLKKRLIGAIVLAALALIFVPMLLKSPDVSDGGSADVPLQIPEETDQDGIKTIDIPLGGSAQIIEQPVANPAVSASPEVIQESPLEPEDGLLPVPQTETAATAAGQFAVVFSAKSDVDSQALASALKQQGLNAKIQSNGQLFRVRVGPFNSREQAELARLRANSVMSGGTVVAMDAVASVAPDATPIAKPISTIPPALNPVVKPAIAPVTAPVTKPVVATTTPVPVPVKKPEAPVVDHGAKGYAVQIGAPSTETAAIALRDKARAAGFTSFIQSVDTEAGRRYRVRLGPEHSRDEAKLLLISVKQKMGIDGFVVAHP